MRYYITDCDGNIWAESDSPKKIEMLFDNIPEDIIEIEELEIISDEEGWA